MLNPSELFDMALEECGGDQMYLASLLGFSVTASAATQFHRWRKNETKPNYDSTLILLHVAGMLRHPDERERRTV